MASLREWLVLHRGVVAGAAGVAGGGLAMIFPILGCGT